MRIHRRWAELPAEARGGCVAIGNFDGVHLGHRAVIAEAAALAARLGTACDVMTFEPHPRELVAPDRAPPRLTSFRRKAVLLEGLGVARCFALPFDRALKASTAEDFARRELAGRLGVRAVVVGHDFRFGQDRGGSAGSLAELGRAFGFAAVTVPPLEVDGAPCSSSRIRALLADGDVTAAAGLLGAPFEIEGVVRHGDRRGRELGFPTANLEPTGRRLLVPPHGIYVVRAGWHAEGGFSWRPAVASLGLNPTFGAARPRLETFVLDGVHALYGIRLRVAFLARLRNELKFDSTAALVRQMQADEAEARRQHALPAIQAL